MTKFSLARQKYILLLEIRSAKWNFYRSPNTTGQLKIERLQWLLDNIATNQHFLTSKDLDYYCKNIEVGLSFVKETIIHKTFLKKKALAIFLFLQTCCISEYNKYTSILTELNNTLPEISRLPVKSIRQSFYQYL